MEIVPAPDFPTGALILGQSGARSTYHDRARLDHDALAPRDRGRPRRSHARSCSPKSPSRSARQAWSRRSPRPPRTSGSRASSDIRDESNRRRRARRHRPQARCDGRRGAEPALAAHARPSRASRPTCWRSAAAARRRSDLRDIIEAFVRFREEVDHPAHQVRAAQGPRAGAYPARPRHRGGQSRRGCAHDPRLGQPHRCARERCSHASGRSPRWRPISRMIDAVETDSATPKTYRLSDAQVRARFSTCACTASTALGRDEIGNELQGARDGHRRAISRSSRDRRRLYEVMRDEFDAIEAEFATPRRSTDRARAATASRTKI